MCCFTKHVWATALLLAVSWIKASGAGPHPFHDDLGSIVWRPTLVAALHEAQISGKPIFLEATREGQSNCVNFARVTFPHEEVKKLLRRYFVCVSVDRDDLPPRYDQYIKSKSISTVPVSLFLSPQGDVISIRQDDPGPNDFLPILKRVMQDPRVAMARGKEKEAARHVESLRQALVTEDKTRIQSAWVALQKIPGLGPRKFIAGDLMDQAEAPARHKMVEAARLVRQGQFPLVRVALEEAEKLGASLPVSQEIRQMLESVPLLESAANHEKRQGDKWRQQSAAAYQQILQKYPDMPLATWTYMRYKSLLNAK